MNCSTTPLKIPNDAIAYCLRNDRVANAKIVVTFGHSDEAAVLLAKEYLTETQLSPELNIMLLEAINSNTGAIGDFIQTRNVAQQNLASILRDCTRAEHESYVDRENIGQQRQEINRRNANRAQRINDWGNRQAQQTQRRTQNRGK